MDLSTPGMSRRSAEAAPALRFCFAIVHADLRHRGARVTPAYAWQAWRELVTVEVSSLHQKLRK